MRILESRCKGVYENKDWNSNTCITDSSTNWSGCKRVYENKDWNFIIFNIALLAAIELQESLRKQGLKLWAAKERILRMDSCKGVYENKDWNLLYGQITQFPELLMRLQESLRKQGLKRCLPCRPFNRFIFVARESTKTRIEISSYPSIGFSPFLRLQESLWKQGLKQKSASSILHTYLVARESMKTRIETSIDLTNSRTPIFRRVARESTKTRIETWYKSMQYS